MLLVINGTDFPEFAGKLHEQLEERDEMVRLGCFNHSECVFSSHVSERTWDDRSRSKLGVSWTGALRSVSSLPVWHAGTLRGV